MVGSEEEPRVQSALVKEVKRNEFQMKVRWWHRREAKAMGGGVA